LKEEETKNFDFEDPIPEEFYASDDNDEFKNEEKNSSFSVYFLLN
jgi:hypothetical protein